MTTGFVHLFVAIGVFVGMAAPIFGAVIARVTSSLWRSKNRVEVVRKLMYSCCLFMVGLAASILLLILPQSAIVWWFLAPLITTVICGTRMITTYGEVLRQLSETRVLTPVPGAPSGPAARFKRRGSA